MGNTCAACPANGRCAAANAIYDENWRERQPVCEKHLYDVVESKRSLYRSAWFEYLKEFYDEE